MGLRVCASIFHQKRTGVDSVYKLLKLAPQSVGAVTTPLLHS